MDDKTLLELAAEAAGIEGVYRVNGFREDSGIGKTMDSGLWNPLTSDGDAFRLAVKLHIELNFTPPSRSRHWTAIAINRKSNYASEELGDTNAATRRAIVRAAAEIAKANKQP